MSWISGKTTDIFVGVDIGGSHVTFGFVDVSGTILLKDELDMDNFKIMPLDLVNLLTDSINKTKQKGWVVASIGIGLPGQSKDNIVVAASNLPNFKNVPLAAMFSKRFNNIPVLLLNDADAALCAEVWGSETVSYYESKKNIAMITLGTGIGLALILNNSLYSGSNGLIEGGHSIVESGSKSRPCGCGQSGCVEAYSSAKNTAQRLKELDEADVPLRSASRSNSLVDATKAVSSTLSVSPVPTGSKEVFERFAMNDFNAVKVVEETAEHLAVFCINICRIVDPDMIIFTGGMSKAGDVLLDLIRKHMKRRTWTCLPTDVTLCTAKSIDAGGMLGAALAGKKYRDNIKGPPSVALPQRDKSPIPRKESPRVEERKTLSPINETTSSAATAAGTAAATESESVNGLSTMSGIGTAVAATSVLLAVLTIQMNDDKGRCPMPRYFQYAQLITSVGFGLYCLSSYVRGG